jgi:hypothetical protein
MGGTFGSIRTTTGTAAPHGSVTIELMDGTGLSTTDSSAIASGNITLQSIPNANNLTVTNNGPTPGSGIIVAASGLGIAATVGTTGLTRIGPITGLINLSTRNGDINLQGNIATSSTASGAITLVAGTAASAPTSAGGDIILTGTRTLTTGAGGSTFLFSGSAANSTGVSALATSARTFYNVDPANMPGSGITSDVHAFYRQNTLPLTLTLDNTSMVYGDSFPTLPSFTLTGGTFNTGDSITSVAWGSAATAFMAQGTYPYSTSNLLTPTFACAAAGCAANYSLTFVNGLTISPRPITITADPKLMTYGGTAPALTYQITAGSVVNNDAVSGALSRAAGVRAGTYAIGQNTLSYGSNYAVTYVPANFTINPAVLTVSMTNTGVTKPYDGSNAAPAGFTPVLSVSGLIANDSAAALSDTGSAYNDAHVVAANKVTVSGLAITGITGSNGSLPGDYVLSANSTFVPATITPVAVTVSSVSIGGTLTKAYDGTTAATGATVSGTVSGGIAGDTLNLSASGMTLAYSSPVAGSRTISASGTLSLVITASNSGSLPSDYSFTAPVIADVPGTITQRVQSPPALLPAPQSTAATTSTPVILGAAATRERDLVAAAVVAPTALAQAVPQIRTAAVLSFGAAADVSMELVVTPAASSLRLGGSAPSAANAGEDTEAKTSTISLFTQTGDSVAGGGAISVVEQGRSIRASNTTTAGQSAAANLTLTGMRYVNVDYKLPSGGQNQLSVGVSTDGILVVKVPAAMRAASDDRSLALIGMATAKERLDVQPANVKSVVIQVE